MNTDNIKNITIKGYNSSKKTYKILLEFNDEECQSQKIHFKWDKIINAFPYIKKELNKDIHDKFLYTMCTSVLIKDKHYRTTKEFLFGVPFKKNIRKISDVQIILDFLLNSKKENTDLHAVNCIFKHAFNMLE